MSINREVDKYISSLPKWQSEACDHVRALIHTAEPNISEEIKFKNRPYFTMDGNICAFLAAKDHINVFIYDPIAPDPSGIINQGHANTTARAIQIFENSTLNEEAFMNLIKAVANNNRKGGWRKIKSNLP